MQQILLAKTEIRVSRLSYGTSCLHHLATRGMRQRLLMTAIDQGFSHFDTSPYYGFGLAESEIGGLPKERLNQITIASKIGLYAVHETASWPVVTTLKLAGRLIPQLANPVRDLSIRRAEQSLESTLRRLKRDWVDILFFHEPLSEAMELESWFDWLSKMEKEGKIRAWGLAGEVGCLLDFLTRKDPLARVIQVRDSLDEKQADACSKLGYPPQFTYGYLSGRGAREVGATIKLALLRNPHGSILVSSRKPQRIRQLAGFADQA